MHHIVMVSGGKQSFEMIKRVSEKIPTARYWFADTRSEDDDLYTFLDNTEKVFGIQIERFADGRSLWEVFKDVKMIGNTLFDVCSDRLKRQVLRKALKELGSPKSITVYLGMDTAEPSRIARTTSLWQSQGYSIDFPLTWPIAAPTQGDWYLKNIKSYGIAYPAIYDIMGASAHGNCKGACVKAGIGHWIELLERRPEIYQWAESEESEWQREIGKSHTILKRKRNGQSENISLKALREEWESQPKQLALFVLSERKDDCACFGGDVFNAEG